MFSENVLDARVIHVGAGIDPRPVTLSDLLFRAIGDHLAQAIGRVDELVAERDRLQSELAALYEEWPESEPGAISMAPDGRWLAGYHSFPTKRAAVFALCGLPLEGGDA